MSSTASALHARSRARFVHGAARLCAPLQVLIALCGCSSTHAAATASQNDSPPYDAGPVAVDAGPVVADAGDQCAGGVLPLFIDSTAGHPSSLHVQVTYNGAPAAFLVDTGSGLTFLQEPVGGRDTVPDAGSVKIGCETRTLIGRAEVELESSHGLPTVGSLGVDAFLRGPSEIDFVGAQLLFHAPGVPFAEAAAWPTAPFDLAKGMVLPHVTLDGKDVRLMFDTGADNVLWLGQQPMPGDVEVQSQDAEGHTLKLYRGTVDLAVGDWHGSVPVLRAPSFPYFEGTVKALGGNIDGLLGLSALGKHVVVDGDARVLHIDLK